MPGLRGVNEALPTACTDGGGARSAQGAGASRKRNVATISKYRGQQRHFDWAALLTTHGDWQSLLDGVVINARLKRVANRVDDGDVYCPGLCRCHSQGRLTRATQPAEYRPASITAAVTGASARLAIPVAGTGSAWRTSRAYHPGSQRTRAACASGFMRIAIDTGKGKLIDV